MPVLRYYRWPGCTPGTHEGVSKKIKEEIGSSFESLSTELCYYIETEKDLPTEEENKLEWILMTPFQETGICTHSVLTSTTDHSKALIIEIGPSYKRKYEHEVLVNCLFKFAQEKVWLGGLTVQPLKINSQSNAFMISDSRNIQLNFSTPLSTNAVSICKSIGLESVSRIEASLRYQINFTESKPSDDIEERLVHRLHDRMTQCRYIEPVKSFKLEKQSDPLFDVDIMGEGKNALERANKELGLAFDDWDLDFYTSLFQEKIRRNPTSVECFDLAQSNSEHCRHWFFRGRLIVDGEEYPESLFKMIMGTQQHTNNNNIIKFSDNSSGIEGYDVLLLKPSDPSEPSKMIEAEKETRHIIFTAETHNFPTGVAPFPGATTGTGGRIRDVQSAGRGSCVVAGTAGYCFGNLNIPGYNLPWEDSNFEYPSNFAAPLEIAIEASNGASDYGNKFGEPVLAGFSRSFGMVIPGEERREYIKPIMFSGGIGQLEGSHITKDIPKKDMEVAKVGGPVYRIGVGGGAASSVQVQGDNKSELDFGAVQRGDAEMEQKLNRVIRACVEMGNKNPIASIHDQGAGGNGNVLKEIVEPAGAVIRASDFQLGDPTLSILELWGAEYQESNAILLARENMAVLEKIGRRERCPVSFVGTVTGDGRIRLENFHQQAKSKNKPEHISNGDSQGDHVTNGLSNLSLSNNHVTNGCHGSAGESGDHLKYPVDLDLDHVLGKMPQKVFHLNHVDKVLHPLQLPESLRVREALELVLRLPSVASKRYLTNKVDRCVTGLVAQQQCVGSLHTPLADVAVTALSYMEKVGSATAIGEQPIKGLIDPAAGARMSVGEALTNLIFASITDLKDVKCSGNWMWPAKLPGEGAMLFDACKAMCELMQQLGIAIDGGKDSLSMAARVGETTVKAPGTLVISTYVGCPDITATVTPDLKCPGRKGVIVHVDLGAGQCRLGGTAFAQCYKQLGNASPDLDHPDVFSKAFTVTQRFIKEEKITAGHDISDGGFLTCLLEMAFAGNCGLEIDIQHHGKELSPIQIMFTEELGLILELQEEDLSYVIDAYTAENIPCHLIGYSLKTASDSMVKVSLNGTPVLEEKMVVLRDVWEETSFQLERLQANPDCVKQEQEGLRTRQEPVYHVPFEPDMVQIVSKGCASPKVAVLREEGSNSDREMSAALHMAGFEVWDVNMQDLCSGAITLDRFHGLVFVGGFSYADVLGSAKGWAATALFNPLIRDQFETFKNRPDTFSLGVCNGCQLMGLLGWVAPVEHESNGMTSQGVLLDHNDAGRFECRYVTVRVDKSPAIMFTGMENTVFGMWSAHGEGKMIFKTPEILNRMKEYNLIPVRYVDDDSQSTITYPFNPNGSPDGVAALCSQDGRHLAIMPHPERCFLPWQCPWMPWEMKKQWDASPWFKMFQNAFDWSMERLYKSS